MILAAGVGLGSVPDWISAVCAAAAAVASGLAWILARHNRALKAALESRDLELRNALNAIGIQRAELNLQTERAAGFDSLSDQARMVEVSPIHDSEKKEQYRITNNSDLVICDIEAKIISNDNKRCTTIFPFLGPGKSYSAYSPHPGAFACDLKFRDFRGNWWHLDGYSHLQKLPDNYMPRVGVVAPGTFDDD
jgi:hypothetical protein